MNDVGRAKPDRGSLADAVKNTRLVAVALIGVVVVCAVLLGVVDLAAPWRIAIQVLTAVAGAALGNTLRIDHEKSTVRNQARPAIRHLFDQVDRLRGLIRRAETYQSALEADLVEPERQRTADWFGGLGSELRNEINATATAIENWSDLAPDVRVAEFDNYMDRENRLPPVPSTERPEDGS